MKTLDAKKGKNMNFLNKMERKYGKYALNNLPMIIIILYAIGYTLMVLQPGFLSYLTLEPYDILHGQIWRLVTWLIIPPESLSLFTVIMLFFYYSLGKTLERTWGAFRFNVYILSGVIFTVLGAFLLYFILGGNVRFGGLFFSTYYINMSIFLAFAASYPNMEVMLYFLIPIKIKWMGLLYGVFIVYEFVQTNWVGKVAIIASLLNFLIFFLSTRNFRQVSPREIHRKQEFKRAAAKAAPKAGVPRHKCAVCGRTELDGDHLEFRYCSKCDGEYEYCQDHLFTHEHVKRH